MSQWPLCQRENKKDSKTDRESSLNDYRTFLGGSIYFTVRVAGGIYFTVPCGPRVDLL